MDEVPEWAKKLINDVENIKENITLLQQQSETMQANTDLIPRIFEMVQANGEVMVDVDHRVTKLEAGA